MNNIQKGFKDKLEYLNRIKYNKLSDIILLQKVNIQKSQEKIYKDMINNYERYFSLPEKLKPYNYTHQSK